MESGTSAGRLVLLAAACLMAMACAQRPVYTVSFDLNCADAAGQPAPQRVVEGDKVAVPTTIPSRPDYRLYRWYADPGCKDAWDFATDTVNSDLTLYARWIAANSFEPEPVSIEFGQTSDHYDYCKNVAAPSGGTLFSVWTRIPTPGSYPFTRGDMVVYELEGDNWNIVGLVGNMTISSDIDAIYNANFMIGIGDNHTYAGDYGYYGTPEDAPIIRAQAEGWVWVAWQVVINADSITFRQWLKFGTAGAVFPAGDTYGTVDGEQTVSFNALRAYANTQDGKDYSSWSPSDARSFQIGFDNAYVNDTGEPNSFLCHARMEGRGDKPTVEYLENISMLDVPDGSAWAQYELNWVNGSPNLSDASGHGLSLEVETGGALHEGLDGPSF